jgi:hypothetical protein
MVLEGLVWSGAVEGLAASAEGVAPAVLMGVGDGVRDGLADGPLDADEDGLVVALGEPCPPPPPPVIWGALGCGVAGAPGAVWPPLCQANPTYPPSGTVSEPAPTEE